MIKRAGKPPGRGSDQFVVRLPDGMRDRIAAVAEQTGRSMNAVIIEALDRQLDKVADDLEHQVSELWAKVEKLEGMVRVHDEQIFPGRYSDLK